eukprot:SAG25_NODE_1485_length_2931_cov_1.939619_3_plen_202_part_00
MVLDALADFLLGDPWLGAPPPATGFAETAVGEEHGGRAGRGVSRGVSGAPNPPGSGAAQQQQQEEEEEEQQQRGRREAAAAAAAEGRVGCAEAALGPQGREGYGEGVEYVGFGARVLINIYDLVPPNGVTELLWLLGLSLHHSVRYSVPPQVLLPPTETQARRAPVLVVPGQGVEIYGREYCFGGHECHLYAVVLMIRLLD